MVAAAVAVLVVVGLAIAGLRPQAGVDRVPQAAADDGGLLVPTDIRPSMATTPADAVTVDIYTDYSSADGAGFLSVNDLLLRGLLDSGRMAVRIHPIALPALSGGDGEYAVRAAGAATCVAEFAPESFWEFHVSLFANQPMGDMAALSDDELVDLATDSRVGSIRQVEECVRDGWFTDWVRERSSAAQQAGGPVVDRLPTVRIGDAAYTGPIMSSSSFRAFIDANVAPR